MLQNEQFNATYLLGNLIYFTDGIFDAITSTQTMIYNCMQPIHSIFQWTSYVSSIECVCDVQSMKKKRYFWFLSTELLRVEFVESRMSLIIQLRGLYHEFEPIEVSLSGINIISFSKEMRNIPAAVLKILKNDRDQQKLEGACANRDIYRFLYVITPPTSVIVHVHTPLLVGCRCGLKIFNYT